MARRTKLNGRGMNELLNSNTVGRDLERRMRPALARAQLSAPVVSGDYEASLRLVRDKTDRQRVRLVSDVPYAFAVEARTGNLARALDEAGGR